MMANNSFRRKHGNTGQSALSLNEPEWRREIPRRPTKRVWSSPSTDQLPRRFVVAHEKRTPQAFYVQSNVLNLHPPKHPLHHCLKPLPIQRVRRAALCISVC